MEEIDKKVSSNSCRKNTQQVEILKKQKIAIKQ